MSWEDAIHWFDEAVNSLHDNDEGGEYDSTMDDPPYQLMAWQAEMYAEGGHGLEKMPERAGRCREWSVEWVGLGRGFWGWQAPDNGL